MVKKNANKGAGCMVKTALQVIIFIFSNFFNAYAQSPTIEWTKTFGGSNFDYGTAGVVTDDNKYIIVGATESSDGDIPNFHGGNDIWVIKLNENGSLVWQKTYGGTGRESVDAIIQTQDKGFIMVGTTNSTDWGTNEIKGDFDLLLLKIDSVGNIQWKKTIGGSNTDYGSSIFQTRNGDFIIGGSSKSKDFDFYQNAGDYDWWVIKTDIRGNIIWKKQIGGSKEDRLAELSNRVVRK